MKRHPWHIAILIPARNEEELLPRCLHSVQAARSRLPAEVTTDVVVVSDCSSDQTFRKAQEILSDSGWIASTSVGVVGSVRALAAKLALKRFSGHPEGCWLANTDADCEVPGDWLVDQVHVANRGFAAVAGVVDVDSFREHGPQVEAQFRSTYRVHADGSHPHVHGANLGVRADAYLQVGGWRDLPTAEDHDLWNRLKRAGVPQLTDAGLRVITSGRRMGRAPLGFADALASYNLATV